MPQYTRITVYLNIYTIHIVYLLPLDNHQRSRHILGARAEHYCSPYINIIQLLYNTSSVVICFLVHPQKLKAHLDDRIRQADELCVRQQILQSTDKWATKGQRKGNERATKGQRRGKEAHAT